MERIDKLLAAQMNISRLDARKFLKSTGAFVDGVCIQDPAFKVEPEQQTITVNGQDICFKRYLYIMMNKPAGVVSASNDGKMRTVVDLVPAHLRRKNLFPAGRLDKDTVGFVLITDDGAFAHRILSPKNHVEKTYVARLKRPLTEDEIKRFEDGLILGDGTRCMQAKISMLPEEEPWAEIKIKEGKYHQIKRMAASLDNEVLYLKRTRIGGLALDDSLQEGECRALSCDEISQIG